MSDTPMDQQVLHREFEAELEAVGDGRTIDMRIVPYNVTAIVRDGPLSEPYEEMWLPGVFDGQKAAAHRVLLNVEHEQGIGGFVGRGIELHSRSDGFHGSFRMLSTQDADKALELTREGSFGGASLEARALKSVREDGVVKRVKAHLINVALCRAPAFEDARVLAVRQQTSDGNGVPYVVGQKGPEIFVPGGYVGDRESLVESLKKAGADLAAGRAKPAAEVFRNIDLEERLERIGFEAITRRTVVSKPWNPAPDRFEDDEWKDSCVIDRGDTFDTAKARYAMPVLEPNGDLNVNGLRTAAAKLNLSSASPTAKAAAARKLVRYYRQAGETPSPSLLSTAAR